MKKLGLESSTLCKIGLNNQVTTLKVKLGELAVKLDLHFDSISLL